VLHPTRKGREGSVSNRSILKLGVLAVAGLLVLVWALAPKSSDAELPEVEDASREGRTTELETRTPSPSERTPVPVDKTITVTVEDRDGRPVGGATITASAAPLARSDARGVAEVSAEFPGDFAVSARGFLTGTFRWDGRRDERVVLERLEHALTGEVRFDTGQPAAGARVLAWKAGDFPSLEEAYQTVRGNGPLLRAECDESGAFYLACPDPGLYELVAGSSGHLSCSPDTVFAAADAEPVRIVIRAAFGLFVAFETEDGTELRVPETLLATNAPSVRYPGGILPIRHDHPGLVFSGIDPALLPKMTLVDVLILAARDQPSVDPTLGPITITGKLPGYDRTVETLRLPPLCSDIPGEAIRLRESAAGWGYLRLLVKPEAAPLLDGTRVIGGGLRVLLGIEGSGEAYRYLVRSFDSGGEARIEPVPFGEYALHVSAWNNELLPLDPAKPENPGLDVVITGEPMTVDLRHLEVGAVEFVLRDAAGVDQSGRAEINFGRLIGEAGTRQSVTYLFKKAPYRVPFFVSGDYGAYVHFPPIEAVRVGGAEIFPLEAGSTTRVCVRKTAWGAEEAGR